MLISFFAIHSYGLLFGDGDRLLSYLNFLAKEPKKDLTSLYSILLRSVSVMGFISAGLFLLSLIKEIFQVGSQYKFLQYAIFMAIITTVLYGALVRIYSNQQAAANLFFFSSLLYLFFDWLNNRVEQPISFLKNIYLLPWYAMLFYTMGVPGWAKIFGGSTVQIRYTEMFKNNFIASLPGGTSAMIILLGILELAVPILICISLVKREFLGGTQFWLKLAMGITILTFTMLSFGLAILFNFAGSSNLIFYSIFTFLMFMLISGNKITES